MQDGWGLRAACAFAGAAAGAAVAGWWFASQLDKANRLRAEEFKGRVRAEQRTRDTMKKLPAAAKSDAAPDAIMVEPVATMVSPLPRRWGTPRQGLLCPSLRGLVVFHKGTPDEALRGITEFSHCWLVWRFHENTNADSRKGRATKRGRGLGVPSLVHAPGLYGEARGLWATRTPHRPNALGLSLVAVEGVCRVDVEVDEAGAVKIVGPAAAAGGEGDGGEGEEEAAAAAAEPAARRRRRGRRFRAVALVVRGMDLIHGTPVLDVKPYLGPGLDAPAEGAAPPLRVPGWVSGGRERSIGVEVSDAAAEQLDELVPACGAGGGGAGAGHWVEGPSEGLGAALPPPVVSSRSGAVHRHGPLLRSAVEEILALDIRGVRTGRGAAWKPGKKGALAGAEIDVDGITVSAEFADDRGAIVVTGARKRSPG